MSEFENVLEALARSAAQDGDAEAFRFLTDSPSAPERLTYQGLYRRTATLAEHLRVAYPPGAPMVVAHPSGLEFVCAFLGCLAAGMIPIPFYPPKREGDKLRLHNVAKASGAKAYLTSQREAKRLHRREIDVTVDAMSVIVTDEIATRDHASIGDLFPRGDLAYLQFTSGTTASPKGVMVTHASLLANLDAICRAFGLRPGGRGVIWLPPYHDMGLVGGILAPLYASMPCSLMAPATFVQSPMTWLREISEQRATCAGGPNFCFERCVSAARQADVNGLDLSSWEVAFVGSEVVRHDTLNRFHATFSACGFRESAFVPCYGLAEATLMVTAPTSRLEPARSLRVSAAALAEGHAVEIDAEDTAAGASAVADAKVVVGCGSPIPFHEIRIVDARSRTCLPPMSVGEIWIGGPSVTGGYYNDPEGSAARFGRVLANGEGPFLATQDLGFMRGHALYVVSRLDDLIIVRGRKFYPDDIESTIESSHSEVGFGKSAAFVVPGSGVDEDDRLVAMIETSARDVAKELSTKICACIRGAVGARHDLRLDDLHIVGPGELPRSSNGKIQRHAARALYMTRSGSRNSPPSAPADVQPSQAEGSRKASDDVIRWIRTYADARINPMWMRERRTVAPHVVLDFGNQGLFGLQVARDLGGMALTALDALRVLEQLAAVDLTLATLVGLHNALVMRPLTRFASPSVKTQHLGRLASGRELGAFAITEAVAGANPRGLQCTATEVEGAGWRITGRKSWIGSAAWASVLLVFARAIDSRGREVGVTGFVLPADAPGLRQGPESLTLGVRAMVQNEVVLDHATAGAESVLGSLGRGMTVAQDAIMHGRLGLGALSLGGMKRCAQLMTRYASRRQIGPAKLVDQSFVQVILTDLAYAVAGLEMLLQRLASMLDEGLDVPEEAFVAVKIVGPELLWRAADDLVQVLGGRGYVHSNPAAGMLEDARLFRIFEGPTEAMAAFLGSRVSHRSDPVRRLLTDTFGSPGATAWLVGAARDLEGHGPDGWVPLGLAAAFVIVEAAADRGPLAEPVRAWARSRAAQAIGRTGSPRLGVTELRAIVDAYEIDIGNVEPSLAGVSQEIDSLLARQSPGDLPSEATAEPTNHYPATGSVDPLEGWLIDWVWRHTRTPSGSVDASTPLVNYGIDSLLAIELAGDLAQRMDVDIPESVIFDFPTIDAIVRRFGKLNPGRHPMPASPLDSARPEITARPELREGSYPLTELQRSYVVGRTISDYIGNVGCHFYYEFDGGPKDSGALSRAWNAVVQRHLALRSSLSDDGTQMSFGPRRAFCIQVSDLRGETPQTSELALRAVRESMSHRCYDPYQWPLFDIRASRISDQVTRHHVSIDLLAVDAAGILQIIEEWRQHYEDIASPSAGSTDGYDEYARRAAAQESSDAFAKARAYWTGRLSAMHPAPGLPLACSPAQLGQPRFVRRSGGLPTARWQRLVGQGRTVGLTPSALLCAVYAEVLRKWSSKPEFTLTLTLFHRMPLTADAAALVGDFTSNLLLAVPWVEGGFTARAQALQKQLMADLQHRTYSGVRVLQALQSQATGQPSWFPVVFTSLLSQQNSGTASRAGLQWLGREVFAVSQTPQVWLDLQVLEEDGRLRFHWDAVENLFPAGQLDAMFESFAELLSRMASDPAGLAQTIRLPQDQEDRLDRYNRTGSPIGQGLLQSGILDWAERAPRSPAVIQPGLTLSFEDIRRRACGVAWRLDGLGIDRGDRVAIVMRKGWEQVAAALGVLMAGATFVPVDTNQPDARIGSLLDACDPLAVLVQPDTPTSADWIGRRTTLIVEATTDASRGPRRAAAAEDDVAYIIFTSGSTGTPKGVMIQHRAVTNTIADINRRFRVGSADRVLALSQLSFDLAIYDIFGVLGAGGAVVMPDVRHLRDPAHWIELMRDHAVTLWNSVPLLMRIATEHCRGRPLLPKSLRLVLLSGDWVPIDLPDAIRRIAEPEEIVSLGGATEASIWSILFPIGPRDPSWRSIPYGFPMAGQTIHVLDSNLDPCTEWTEGDLYIGGAGLAQGYWNDAQRTSAKFIVHPSTGERLYGTGDRGRRVPEGHVEFLGRLDGQVKIRGHRVELGEIESVLRRHPRVLDCVVVHDRQSQSGVLRGFVVAKDLHEVLPAARRNAPASVLSADLRACFPPLADAQAFARDIEAMEGEATLAMLAALRTLGAFQAPGETRSAAQIVASCGLRDQYTTLIARWLRWIAEDGLLIQAPDGRFTCVAPLGASKAIRSPCDALPPELTHYFRTCCDQLPDLLRGTSHPLSLLFPRGSWRTAEALYETNALAQFIRARATPIMKRWVENHDGAIRVLEIGAGVCSLTRALLPVLPADRTRYLVTDVTPFFHDSGGRKKLADYAFVEFGVLDILRDPLVQGLPPNDFDVVVASNVLHNAQEIGPVLGRIRRLLAPGGMLMMEETTRNLRAHAVSVGFVDGLGRLPDPDGPFLALATWNAELARAGFDRVESALDPATPEATFGLHLLVAQIASRAVAEPDGLADEIPLTPEGLRDYLAQQLPAHMVPNEITLMCGFPLTPNGKLDVKQLPAGEGAGRESDAAGIALDGNHGLVTRAWRLVLNHDRFAPDDNFFEVGGDSLLMVRLQAQLTESAGRELTIVDLFAHPTVRSMASLLAREPDPIAIRADLAQRIGKRNVARERRRNSMGRSES